MATELMPPANTDLPVASELFLIGLHERTGEPLLSAHAMGMALAGGLLGELVLAGAVTVAAGRVGVVDGAPTPSGALDRRLFGQIILTPDITSVQQWLKFLAQTAVDDVGQRLTSVGWLYKLEPSRWQRHSPGVLYRPVDKHFAAVRSMRLARMLQEQAFTNWQQVFVAALVESVGLLKAVLWEGLHPGVDHLEYLVDQMKTRAPALDHLRRQFEECFHNAVLAGRT